MNGSWPGFCLMCLSEAPLKLFSLSSWSCWNVAILIKTVSFFFLVEEICFIILKLCLCMWTCQYECQRLQRPEAPGSPWLQL